MCLEIFWCNLRSAKDRDLTSEKGKAAIPRISKSAFFICPTKTQHMQPLSISVTWMLDARASSLSTVGGRLSGGFKRHPKGNVQSTDVLI